MNVLIGFFSSLIILVLYRLLEKDRIPSIGKKKIFFVLLVLLASYMVEPYQQTGEWLIWLLFFYTALDDMVTKTIFVPIYFLVVLLLSLQGVSWKLVMFSICILIILFIFAKKTKETFLSIGDVYCIFALSFWLGYGVGVAVILAFFLAGVVVPFVLTHSNTNYLAFTPFLVISSIMVKYQFYVSMIFGILVVLNVLFWFVRKYRKKYKIKKGLFF